ncbi:BTB/POZ domain protein, partial [Trifolium medium]|nr:BTB/POZ domain protein [Trifolium medium]
MHGTQVLQFRCVSFEEVHRLGDGQVKHSPEVFYAGSLWKVSIQAFNDEDP